jgi:glutaredoxin-like protein NrdH
MFEHEVKNKIPLLLAISTCPRCQRMKRYLKTNGVQAKIVDVDLLSLGEKKETYRFLRPINPRLSYPTLIVGELAVVGEDYEGVKEVLGL